MKKFFKAIGNAVGNILNAVKSFFAHWNYRLQPYFLAKAEGYNISRKPKSMSVIIVIPFCCFFRLNQSETEILRQGGFLDKSEHGLVFALFRKIQ